MTSDTFDTDSALGTDTITEAAGGGTDTLDFSGSSNVVTVKSGNNRKPNRQQQFNPEPDRHTNRKCYRRKQWRQHHR